MHLTGQANRLHAGHVMAGAQVRYGPQERLPPGLRILLRPVGMQVLNGKRRFRGPDLRTCRRRQAELHRRRADIYAQKHG